MFIAMNRFRVKPGSEPDFEAVWLNREVYLDAVPGFVEFHLLRGPKNDDHTLYSRTRSGAARPTSRPGPDRRPFATPTRTPAATNRSISVTPSSRALRSADRVGQARLRAGARSGAAGASGWHRGQTENRVEFGAPSSGDLSTRVCSPYVARRLPRI
jgi:hypothetical protein